MTSLSSTSMPEEVLPQRTHDFTVAEYHQMAEVFEGQRVELLRGKIVDMSPIKSRHAAVVSLLTEFFFNLCHDQYAIRVQNPVRLSDYSEPEPDLALVRPRADHYANAHPTPQEIMIVVEVADSSLDKDRRIKLPLYAEAGIPEYWIVDLTRDQVEVYTRPDEGAYSEERVLKAGDRLEHDLLGPLDIRAFFPDRD